MVLAPARGRLVERKDEPMHLDVRKTGTLLAGAMAAVIALSSCGFSDDPATGPDGSALTIIASTNVWGSVAKAVGGDAVVVTSIISDPAQDPHSFEASSSTLLTVSKADLIIENGGGYDDYMGRMVESVKSSAAVLDAVDISGKTTASGEVLNEHVWYDLPTVQKVADKIAEQLGQLEPEAAAQFAARASAFNDHIDELIAKEARLKGQVAGMAIGITEPVPLYLTDACGLENDTPAEFSDAIEEGTDVPPAVLNETLTLFTDAEVAALVYNEQTTGPLTEQVKDAAQAAHIPIVPVTETLPANVDYLAWMGQNLSNLKAALVKP
jgi:zinc/manganese transport system substrate-binding protein